MQVGRSVDILLIMLQNITHYFSSVHMGVTHNKETTYRYLYEITTADNICEKKIREVCAHKKNYDALSLIYKNWTVDTSFLSTAVGQAVACAPVTQRARVRSPVGTSFLGEFFRDFFSPVRQMSGSFRPQGSRISFGHHYHHQSSFITGANDLRCWRVLKNLKYTKIYIYKFQNISPESKSCLILG